MTTIALLYILTGLLIFAALKDRMPGIGRLFIPCALWPIVVVMAIPHVWRTIRQETARAKGARLPDSKRDDQ
jgi:hypothetical protein